VNEPRQDAAALESDAANSGQDVDPSRLPRQRPHQSHCLNSERGDSSARHEGSCEEPAAEWQRVGANPREELAIVRLWRPKVDELRLPPIERTATLRARLSLARSGGILAHGAGGAVVLKHLMRAGAVCVCLLAAGCGSSTSTPGAAGSTSAGSDGANGGAANANASAGSAQGGAANANASAGSAQGGSPANADTCQPIVPCGGSVVGMWRINQYCADLVSIPIPFHECPEASVRSGTELSGTISFDANGSMQADLQELLYVHAHIPASCASEADCRVFESGFAPMPRASGDGCVYDVKDGCTCSKTQRAPQPATGSYQVLASQLTVSTSITAYPLAMASFCASGNALLLQTTDRNGQLSVSTLAK